MLTPAQIAAAPDIEMRDVHVPEWASANGDDVVLIGTMGALDRARLQDWMDGIGHVPAAPEPDETELLSCDTPADDEPETASEERQYTHAESTELMVRWCAACIVDGEGNRPFNSPAGIAELGRCREAGLYRLYQAALDLHLETPAATEAEKKSSKETPAAASGSG